MTFIDMAGSENTKLSTDVNDPKYNLRIKEANFINKSLMNFGQLIRTSISENPSIQYRP